MKTAAKPLVKICGIKSADEARAVLEVGAKFGRNLANSSGENFNKKTGATQGESLQSEARNFKNGVSFLGVIFAPSKRRVSAAVAREISSAAHKAGAKCAGVFAGQSDCEITEICEFAELDVAQIHGEISANLYANLKAMGLEVWRVYSVLDALPAVDTALCDMPLFDCKGQNAGGNGISFDWEILRGVKFNFGMAGGIGEHNACEAIKFNPRVLDLNSKVEDENLQKIPATIEIILKAISAGN
ncbi:phosphoribosylanthranilate isomerase [uncultured Campylobacter sp.]|uniref:phosphoribosylanthranilate isomerase n=1 Tax=uncultured Campylobacter sp. TaxID=218934 RepID=UPI0025E309B7|nr:phosphoribosylanthranilate isomerase [uncultured Campylobacter sp.]